MFKKILFASAAFVFATGILGASIWRTSAQSISQNYELTQITDQEATESIGEEATEAASKEVDYFLAYPGILPDHLLYPLKMIRDQIRLFLTTGSLKKAELCLLYADKRLGAAKMLIEKNELDLGLTTLTKAEKYLEKAINQEEVAREKNEETRTFLEKLSQATLKHEEMILNFENKISEEKRSVYNNALQYTRQGRQRINQNLGK